MDIILYVKNLKGRGVQKVYLNLAKGLQELGHTIHFVIRENIIELPYNFLHHFYIFVKNITDKLDALALTLSHPILIANDVKTTQDIKNIPTTNIYHTVHMLWGERIFKQLRLKKWFELKKLYKNKQIIAVSEAVKADLLNKVGIKPKSITVIHDGFDIQHIQKLSKQETITLSKPYILALGALSREKNYPLLLKSYAKLDTSLDLLIIGKGKQEQALKKLTQKLHIEEHVHFLGFQSNPYPYIAKAKLLISTSLNEALPGVTIESLILHTPVVSTDTLGIRSVLREEFSEYIVTSSSMLTKTIKKALKNYPAIKPQIYQNFDYLYIAQQYIDHITKSLKD